MKKIMFGFLLLLGIICYFLFKSDNLISHIGEHALINYSKGLDKGIDGDIPEIKWHKSFVDLGVKKVVKRLNGICIVLNYVSSEEEGVFVAFSENYRPPADGSGASFVKLKKQIYRYSHKPRATANDLSLQAVNNRLIAINRRLGGEDDPRIISGYLKILENMQRSVGEDTEKHKLIQMSIDELSKKLKTQ